MNDPRAGFIKYLYLGHYREQTSSEAWPGVEMDVAYVMVALAVPAATVLGLWWFARSRGGASVHTASDPDKSGLAASVAAIEERLNELTDRLETMRDDAVERERRLTGRLNALLALTERATRIDLSVGEKPGARRPPRR